MSFWSRFRRPDPSDYDTEEEYMDALEVYERAEDQALEESKERYYGII